MLPAERIFTQIRKHIDDIIAQTESGNELWKLLTKQHPADIADLLVKLDGKRRLKVYSLFNERQAAKIFEKLPVTIRTRLIRYLDLDSAGAILKHVHTDELTNFFEHLSDKDLKKYLKLLLKKQRNTIISHLNFAPKSAGRIMNSDVLSLQKDFTVKKCITILQRTAPQVDVLRRMYLTDKENILLGYISLEELVLSKPETPLKNIMHKNVLLIDAHEDQEDVAKKMHHYDLSSAPVVDKHGHFLGVITADSVFDVLEEEATEDVYKMSGLAPGEHSYFATSAASLIKQRISWLVGLLLLQSISGFIVESYQDIIQQHVIISFFITMLIGTGGNAGNQSATLVIRGLATGEIGRKHGFKVLMREFSIGLAMAAILMIVSFARVFVTHNHLASAIAISLSLFFIVVTSMSLGTLIPLLLERFNIDPAHSAAPFLATLMDIIGMLIYCLICSRILG